MHFVVATVRAVSFQEMTTFRSQTVEQALYIKIPTFNSCVRDWNGGVFDENTGQKNRRLSQSYNTVSIGCWKGEGGVITWLSSIVR